MSDEIVARKLRLIPEDVRIAVPVHFSDTFTKREQVPSFDPVAAGLIAHEAADLIDQQAARIKELERDAAFRLEASSRETEEARFYRYLRDEAGQSPDDHDGPMICSGLGDNFDYLRGEECDKEIRAAIDAELDKADK